jgi:hypothetical protein
MGSSTVGISLLKEATLAETMYLFMQKRSPRTNRVGDLYQIVIVIIFIFLFQLLCSCQHFAAQMVMDFLTFDISGLRTTR